ncbi:MAG: cbb3-type cytochrome c oxidase subunit 3 [Hyphomonadaceae bacterium]|nr:cbb3-type cytochrome c oxidase subunit 3 [Hyphomonadaceae bacterium]
MTYEQSVHFAQTWGVLLLALCFGVAVLYALWPSNKETFARAARAPLDDGE